MWQEGGKLYIGGTFVTVDGVARVALAALDPTTGALSPDLSLQFSGPRTGTSTSTSSTSPDGSRLIAIGNWTLVNGLQRDQIVIVDLTTPNSVFDWATTRFQQPCSTPTCATWTSRPTAATS